jgi:hypothetical protein
MSRQLIGIEDVFKALADATRLRILVTAMVLERAPAAQRSKCR